MKYIYLSIQIKTRLKAVLIIDENQEANAYRKK